MEKRVVLAIALTVLLFYGFIWLQPKPPAPPPQPKAPPVVQQGTTPSNGSIPSILSTPAPAVERRPSDKYPAVADASLTKLSNAGVDLTFDAKGGALKAADAWGCIYHARGDRSVAGDPGAATSWTPGLPGALAADVLSSTIDVPDLAQSNWKPLPRDGDAATWQFEGPGFVLTRTVKLSSDPNLPWHADVSYAFKNVSLKTPNTLTLEVFGPATAKPAVNEYDAGLLIAQSGEEGDVESIPAGKALKELADNPKVERTSPTGKWAWIAQRADFHLGALVPTEDLPAGTTVALHATTHLESAPGATPMAVAIASFRIPLEVPAAGEEKTFSFLFYAGPNRRSLLADETSPYHMLSRALVSRGFLGIKLTWISLLLAWLLRQIASTGIGYGLSVLALTVIVRGAMFPLSRKSQVSMRLHAQKMQRLKPKLDAIKEKYKDSRKQQEATMKAMREEKVSMLPAGCFLAFLQMPIWIALYGVLQSTFEMRHASFLWVKDLTAPDHLLHMPYLGSAWSPLEWLNLLPLLMMATWYTSAAMQPLPDDPQQAQTAKMMRWMPVIMGLFLYSYPAGLTLYMTTSAIWSIGETWFIRKVWLSNLK